MKQFRTMLFAAAAGVLVCAGCDRNMVDQARHDPFEASGFFPDGAAARTLVEGVVVRHPGFPTAVTDSSGGLLPRPDLAGRQNPGDLRQVLQRGRERFDVYCAMCHARDGYGQGMIVQRGYPAATSLHEERLRSMPDSYIYDVVTNGLGKMPPFRGQIGETDRRAIVQYVRALQLSQNARMEHVPAADRTRLGDVQLSATTREGD